MNAGWMFLRTELRRRWRSWLALALIVGAFAGAVEAAAAGARRVPAGVLLGRAAWRVFAGQLGILPVVAVPWQSLTAMAAIALAVAVAAAAVPGESAARSAPATIFRSG
jgi:hypothetical protein